MEWLWDGSAEKEIGKMGEIKWDET